MSFLGDTFRAYARDARAALSHAPIEVALGVALAVGLSVAIRRVADDEWYARQWAASLLAVGPLLALSALRLRGAVSSARRWMAAAGVLLAAAAYAFFVFDPDRGAEGWRGLCAGTASIALGVLLPSLVGAGDTAEARRDVFWRWWTGLLRRAFGVGLYAGALFAALAGAIAAVIGLFELGTPDHLYQDLAGAIFFALAPWVVVGGLPRLASGEAPSAVERVWMGRLGRFLWGLVMLIYLAILYAYAVKVVATQALPKNLLSPVVLFAAVFGLLGAALLAPLADDGEEAPYVTRLVRLVPALVLPLLPLAAWALLVRQAAYGWTEARYLRMALIVALTLLSAWGTYRLVRRRPPLARAVPAVVGVIALLAAIGPWSAQSVSLRSQRARLREALRALHALPLHVAPGDTLRRTEDLRVITSAQDDAVRGSARWLMDEHGPKALEGLVVGAGAFEDGWKLARVLPFRTTDCDEGARRRYASTVLDSRGPFTDVPGGTVILVENLVPGTPHRSAGEPDLVLRDDTVFATTGGWRAAGTLDSITAGAVPIECDVARPDTRLTPEAARVALLDAGGARRATLIVTQARVERSATVAAGQPRVQQVSGWLVVEGP